MPSRLEPTGVQMVSGRSVGTGSNRLPRAGRQLDEPSRRLAAAVAEHRAGRVDAAEAAYRQVLDRWPDNADALHSLGILLCQTGRPDQALSLLQRAATVQPSNAAVRNSLGVALKELGRLDQAAEVLREALGLKADYPEALTNLGNVLRRQGQLEEAAALHSRAVRLRPDYAEAHANLATTLLHQKSFPAACEALEHAVRLAPAKSELQRALGLARLEAGRYETAAAALQEAIRLGGDSAATRLHLALALFKQGRAAEAAAACRVALQFDPADAAAFDTLGTILRALEEPAGAEQAFREAIRLDPGLVRAQVDLGVLLLERGLWTEARSQFEKALGIRPDDADARWNMAQLLLLFGEFSAGWELYRAEASRRLKHGVRPHRALPEWDGSRNPAGRVLFWGEQGVGDEVMFARFIGEATAFLGQPFGVEAEPRLLPLFERSFPETEFVSSAGPHASVLAKDFFAQAPLAGLGSLLRPRLESFQPATPYLKADPERTAALRSRYSRLDSKTVGISWRGGTGASARQRSLTLAQLAPILRQPNVDFVNLQYGECAAELTEARARLGVEIRDDPEIDALKDLDGFAAQVAAMDVVVSIDNATVHFAGALGVPVYVLLPAVPSWRWLLDREDSVWYASARLFRQERLGEWEPVIQRAAEALATASETPA